MKKTVLSIIILILVSVFLSCSESSSSEINSAYTVSGKITYLGEPVANATVSVDDKYNFTVQTDSSGYYIICGVAEGDHKLKIAKTFSEKFKGFDGFSEKTYDINVNQDLYLQSLTLPKCVEMFSPIQVTHNTMKLVWNSSDATDFREYKIYRHTTSGLDETTGVLAHVSTTIKDTVFVDSLLIPATKYYYRVYVMNDYGRLGGSNIVNAVTTQYNLLKNGNFETVNTATNMADLWYPNHTVIENGDTIWCPKLDSVNKVEGKYSCHFKSFPKNFILHYGNINGEFGLNGTIDYNPVDFIYDTEYELTCWVKTKNTSLGFALKPFLGGFNFDQTNSDWTKISKTFILSQGSEYIQLIVIPDRSDANQESNEFWIDDVRICKKL